LAVVSGQWAVKNRLEAAFVLLLLTVHWLLITDHSLFLDSLCGASLSSLETVYRLRDQIKFERHLKEGGRKP
jgi:hypothetical protein